MPDRFPPPYSVKDIGHAWEVADANGFKITWFHYEVENGLVGTKAPRMTREQAYAFAVQFARLPEYLERLKGK
jgi:hypothetical protein